MATLIAMMNLVPMVSAAETEGITVTVTVSYLSVSLSSSTVAFGTIRSGIMVNNSVIVTNDGNWPINLTLRRSEAVNSSGGLNWASPGANINDVGSDKYVMAGRFNATGALPNDSDIITNQTQTADGTKFGNGGRNIAVSGTETLRLYFNAPTSNTQKSQQTITVTVGAVAG